MNINWMMINLLRKALRRNLTESRLSFPLIRNVNKDLNDPKQQHALFCYITSPFDVNIESDTIYHSNQLEAIQILRILINLNFSVDICHCLEEEKLSSIASRHYDLIFGFGDVFMESSSQNKDAIRILYCTEAHPNYLKAKEKERLEAFEKRKKYRPQSKRTNAFYKIDHFKYADHIVYKGNGYNKRSFEEVKNVKQVLPIFPSPFVNKRFTFGNRNMDAAKKNFLWFGSMGAIHKGLDLLVEVFMRRSEVNLYICGLSKDEESLFQNFPSNIKNIGFVDVQSDEFLDLVKVCGFVILPSCSEGMASGVLTCMRHGLIPIVTAETGIDLLYKEFLIEEMTLNFLEDKILECSEMDTTELLERNIEIFKHTCSWYSMRNFNKVMKKNIEDCLEGS